MLIKESTLRRIIQQELKREMRLNEGKQLKRLTGLIPYGVLAGVLFQAITMLSGEDTNIGQASNVENRPGLEQIQAASDKLNQKAISLKNTAVETILNSQDFETRAMMTYLAAFNHNHAIHGPSDLIEGSPLYKLLKVISEATNRQDKEIAAKSFIKRKIKPLILRGGNKKYGAAVMLMANISNQLENNPGADAEVTIDKLFSNFMHGALMIDGISLDEPQKV